ncbi:hypothetical protein [Paracoccus sp. (in: a-proteobacteria)]|uniref:hypothetical protein n=1 Tax=Paracoccus sp. TaxID=267 RepID=UPI0032201C86
MESVTPLFQPTPRAAKPKRSGRLWETLDYELLVEGIREGLDVPALAERVGRVESSVWQRLRRLVPLPQRGCLADQLLPVLRTALADPAYDWQAEMRLTPPPAPIVRKEIVHNGLDGLTADDAVAIAYALLASGGDDEAAVLSRLMPRLEADDLIEDLIELRARKAVRASPFSIAADAAWAHASYWVRGRRPDRDRYRSYAPFAEPTGW